MKLILMFLLVIASAEAANQLAERGECKTIKFGNGVHELVEGTSQCNPNKGFFPLLDPETGYCTCEKVDSAVHTVQKNSVQDSVEI